MNYVLTPESRCRRERRLESVGCWRKDEFLWMSLALVYDRKGIQSQNLCTNFPSYNVLSVHSSSFTAVPSSPSPVSEGHDGLDGMVEGWPSNWHVCINC